MARITFDPGLEFLSFLTILFIALKLMKYIAWSWWWVLSPILIPTAIAITMGIVIITYVAIWGKNEKTKG